jgi:hypothetical protein
MDAIYTQKSASYLDLHLAISSRGRLKTQLCDKRDDFTFPIVDFPFISSNIPASPAYGVSQLMYFSRFCVQYSDYLDRAQPLTQKLLKQGYFVPKLKSLLQIFYDRYHNRVDCYEISISQMAMDILLFR